MEKTKTYEEYLKEAGNVFLAYYLEAADYLNVKYTVLVKGLLAKFEYQNRHWHIINTVTPLVPAPSSTICKRKHLASLILEKEGLPVPNNQILLSPIDAIKFYGQYKDIVIKPTQQLGGAGITILPQNEDQVLKAYEKALEKSKENSKKKVMGEEFIQGENYRLLVLDDKVIGAVRRKAAHIVGNSKNTIRKLIGLKNEKRKDSIMKPIAIDNEVILKLQRENLNLESIPKEGQEIILRYNCNLTTGGSTQECMEEVHNDYKEMAIKAVKAVGSKFGGVDIIAEDISKPSKAVINEINYNPGLRLHYKVNEGEVVRVAIPIMKYLRDKEY
jgi:cyanophycin synthetase